MKLHFSKLAQNLVRLIRPTLLLLLLFASSARGGIYDGPGVKEFFLPFSTDSVVKVTRYVDHYYPDDHMLPLWWFSPTPRDKTSDLGTDFGAVRDTEVRAAASGTVIAIQDGYLNSYPQGPGTEDGGGQKTDGGSYGNYVVIEHDDLGPNNEVVVTLYAHLNKNSLFDGTRSDLKHIRRVGGEEQLAQGSTVKAGDYIGRVGFSGNTYGYHLHFGVFVDPSVTRQDRYYAGAPLNGGTIGPGTGYVVDPFSSDPTKQWWKNQKATKNDPYIPPQGLEPVVGQAISESTGTPVGHAKVEVDEALACYADEKGVFTIPKEFITGLLQRIKVSWENLTSQENRQLLLANSFQPKDEIQLVAELKPTVIANLPTNRFANGDVVEVYGTGNGLRARYPDPTSERPKVMADGAIGTIVGGPVTGDGYVRWKIQYDALPGIDAWSADGEPSTGQMFLRKREVVASAVPASPALASATALSTSQINLTWINQAPNAVGIRIERATGSGSYSRVASLGPGVSAWTESNLAAGTTYSYRVQAYNAAGSSKYSNIATAKTPPATGGVYSLLVDAVDLDASQILNVSVSSWSGTSSDYRTNTTSFTRTATSGTQLSVLAPATLTGGRVFQYWTRDGNSRIYGTATVKMDTNHNLIAVYGGSSSPPPRRTFAKAEVTGPSSVDENNSATYKLRYTYSDGSQEEHSAKWTVDPDNNASISSSGVLDTDSVDSDQSVEVTANFKVDGQSMSKTKTVTIKNKKDTATYTLSLNATNGHIIADPKMSHYPAGTKVRLIAQEDHGYVFNGWSGSSRQSTADADTVFVTMDGNKSITANFTNDTSVGSMHVKITPDQAVAEGAQWQFQHYTAWRDSDNTQTGMMPERGYVNFKDIPGWITPDQIPATVMGGKLTEVTAAYQEILGAVQVTLVPTEAGVAGGRWRIDGSDWKESGVTLSSVARGSHTIDFQAIDGWSTPASQNITVARGFSTTATGSYGAPVGLPLVTSISPATGPLEGGTNVTLQGVNFQPGAMVTFGGVAAKSVQVVNPSQIIAVTPARASYGTVAVMLSSGGQTATRANGFSYLNPLGSNMELVGQLGGSCLAVELQGNYAYTNEGTGFVIYDITNPVAPVERGRIALPNMIRGIAAANGKAYLACGTSGLYILDVSTPSAPAILGFYDTDGEADGITVNGNLAYVGDGPKGLSIFDVSSAQTPTLVSNLALSGIAQRLAFQTIAEKSFTFVSTGAGGLRIVDVTTPASPSEKASISAGDGVGIKEAKPVGNLLYVSGSTSGVQVFDVTTPSSPVLKGAYTNTTGDTLDVVGTKAYSCDGYLRILETANPAAISNIGQANLGNFPNQIRVANGYAFAAFGREGFKVASVASSFNPVLKTTTVGIGQVDGVAVQGGLAVTGRDNGGADTVDISNPAKPFALGHVGTSRVSSIAIVNNTAILVNYGDQNVGIVDLSQPKSPLLLTTLTTRYGWDVTLFGDKALLAGSTRESNPKPTLDVLDLSTPSSPKTTGSIQLSTSVGSAQGICTVGSWGLAVRANQSLDILDLSNAVNPKVVGQLALSSYAHGVAASTDASYAYVACGTGFQVVAIADKTAPVLIQTIDPPQSSSVGVDGVKVVGTNLYVSDYSWVYVYNISDPANPVQVANYDIPRVSNFGTIMDVVGDLLCVAGSEAGLIILRVKDFGKPNIAITSPASGSVLETNAGTLSINGTASDNKAVTMITWQNDRGGGGTAIGTTNWTISSVVLAPGTNVIKVSAQDADGNSSVARLTVNAVFDDANAPVVAITGPKTDSQFTVTASVVTLRGSAADNQGVANVSWANQRGGSGTALMTGGAWSVPDLVLQEGANAITVTAADAANNKGTATALIFYTPPDDEPPTVTINFPTAASTYETKSSTINLSGESFDNQLVSKITWKNSSSGGGEVSSVSPWSVNDIALRPGLNVIDVTATDASGNAASDTLSVTYTPPQPITLAPKASSYTGLVNGDFIDSMYGSISLQRTVKGMVSGKVLVDGRTFSFSGKLLSDGSFTKAFSYKLGLVTFRPNLTLQVGDDGTFVGNWDTGTDMSYQILGDENAIGTKADPIRAAAKYTAHLRSFDVSPDGGAVRGYLTATIGANGSAALVGALPDGTALSGTSRISIDGLLPLAFPLYQGKHGSLFGMAWLNGSGAERTIAGDLRWTKPAQVSGIYKTGIADASVQVAGHVWTAPRAGARLVPDFDAAGGQMSITLSGGNLPSPIIKLGRLSTANVVTITPLNPEKLSLRITPGNGLFSGSFTHSDGKTRSIRGAFVQDPSSQSSIEGFFPGVDVSGLIQLEVPAP